METKRNINGISVVIPAFNEESAIVDTIENCRKVLVALSVEDFEIIIVDDGSTDRTAELAHANGARVVRHPGNGGYGLSLKDGIRAAKFDTVVITDADGTYPVDKIPDLLEEYRKGFNMVVGARTGKYYRETFYKSPMRLVLRWIVEFTAGRKIPDVNSGLRVFSRNEIVGYFNHLCNTFSFTTSVTLAYLMTGRYLKHIPIPYYKRIGSSKVRLLRDSMRTLQFIVQAALYYNPLKIFLILCGLVLSFSVLCFGISLVTHLTVTFYLGIGGILMSILIFSLGLLSELVRQIMIKDR